MQYRRVVFQPPRPDIVALEDWLEAQGLLKVGVQIPIPEEDVPFETMWEERDDRGRTLRKLSFIMERAGVYIVVQSHTQPDPWLDRIAGAFPTLDMSSVFGAAEADEAARAQQVMWVGLLFNHDGYEDRVREHIETAAVDPSRQGSARCGGGDGHGRHALVAVARAAHRRPRSRGRDVGRALRGTGTQPPDLGRGP